MTSLPAEEPEWTKQEVKRMLHHLKERGQQPP